MLETSVSNIEASAKYWNDAWLDQLIEEVIRLAKEQGIIEKRE